MNTKCPDCGGEMEEGIIPDYNYMNNAVQQVWATNARKNLLGGLKFDKKYIVKTYLCKSCGFLKSYAK